MDIKELLVDAAAAVIVDGSVDVFGNPKPFKSLMHMLLLLLLLLPCEIGAYGGLIYSQIQGSASNT